LTPDLAWRATEPGEELSDEDPADDLDAEELLPAGALAMDGRRSPEKPGW